jgi:23S rRNA pseudouridine2604 synthase
MKKGKVSNETKGIQINKYISNTGFCSRREAEKLIEQARVTINDELCLLSARVNIGDIVEVDGEPLIKKTKPIYIAFNKPTGITSTTDLKDKTNIISFINHPKRIFPIGRLDKDSEGLILLTNDGDIVNKILRDGNNHEKEYIVTVDNPLTQEAIMGMSNGVKMLGTTTKPCTVKQEGPKRFRIILTQGLNRQIRRMCAIYGYTVKSLKRVRIMHLHLDNLKTGAWRNLTTQEISLLEKQLSNSIK